MSQPWCDQVAGPPRCRSEGALQAVAAKGLARARGARDEYECLAAVVEEDSEAGVLASRIRGCRQDFGMSRVDEGGREIASRSLRSRHFPGV